MLLSIISPLHVNGTPSKSGAKRSKDNIIALLQFFLKIPNAKRKCSGTSITITLYIDKHLFHGVLPNGVQQHL